MVLTFEERISHLLSSFINYLNKLEKCKCASRFCNHSDDLRNEHEGKTLLHLCAQLGYRDAFDKLTTLKKILAFKEQSELYFNMKFFETELNLFNLDHNGDTPMTLACRHGHGSIASDLFKWIQNEPILPKKWTESIQTSIEEAKLQSNFLIAENLMHSLNILQSEKSNTYENNFRLIEGLEDLGSLLINETVNSYVLGHLNAKQDTNQTTVDNTLTELNYTPKSEPLSNMGICNPSNQQELSEIDLNLTDDQLKQNENLIHGQESNIDDYQNLFSTFDGTIVDIHHNDSVYNLSDSNLIGDDSIKTENDSQQFENKAVFNHINNFTNDDLQNSNLMSIQNNQQEQLIGQKQPKSSISSDDDQDKKIKTLADNIIAAMPHKIKTNSYSSLNIQHPLSLADSNLDAW